ncbi:suppressor of deletion of TFIIS [Dimargaris verticillata]|uniref:Suppressor of deletion of TFIIS n=1 Tax=Dimargaris verticillata TaxID=2761393 RepID=A0A9W8BBZ6_9FUNG|nr:suppressor of deletion of TFIIS [Dimargaris verticillata]
MSLTRSIMHATRVLKCLGIDDLFELVIYCDYGLPDFTCKPEEQSFDRAMRLAQVTDPDQCYFVDDSADNVHMAKSLGWHTVHLCPSGASDAGDHQIQDILTLPRIYPDLWAPSSSPSP